MDINDVDIACEYVLKKGIFYKDYFVFMTEENDGLCVVIGGKLYIYPIRLINDITDIHLEDNRIYLKTKEWVSAFITELDLDINEDIAIKDNFFCNISNYREKSAKEINNIISAKKALVEGLKGFNKK